MDFKFWLPLALSVALPLAGIYATFKVMESRVSHIEAVTDAEATGRYRAKVEANEKAIEDAKESRKAIWQAIGRLRSP